MRPKRKAYLINMVFTVPIGPRVYNIRKGRDSSDIIPAGYGLDGPGIESRGGEIFSTCLDRPFGTHSLLYNGHRVFPGVTSGRGVTLTPLPLLMPWSRKSRAILLHPLRAVRPVQRFRACKEELYHYYTYGPYGP